MEWAIEVFAAICLSVLSVSHVVQPRVWADFFIWLRAKGRAGVFAMGLLYLHFGAFLVAFHNVWHGLPIIFTILGLSQVIKGAIYLVAPQVGMLGMSRITPERSWLFVVGGAMMLVLSAAMWYVVLAR